MQPARRKIPGVLVLLLSALGILIGFAAGVAIHSMRPDDEPSRIALISAGSLAFLVGLLNIPAFMYAIRYLRQKDGRVRQASLLKPASILLVIWFGLLGLGHWVSQSAGSRVWLAPLTVVTVVIPVWWIVEFLRRGLPRSSALREWGTLTVGLTVIPLLVMLIELMMIAMLAVIGLIALSTQPGALEQLANRLQALQAGRGGVQDLESWLAGFAGNPLIVTLVFLSIGFVAPFIEEFFKPMAIWFQLKQPLSLSEGYSLGLIAGGAFALMESAGLVIQISFEERVAALALRAATGFLHIGLSGLVGYGLASAWQDRKPLRALFYLLGVTGLHGLWNVLALVAGFSVTTIPSSPGENGASPSTAVALILMGAVFVILILLTQRLNRKLQPVRNGNPVDPYVL